MPRPPAHDVHDFLDAAVERFAAGGASAVTMSAVAGAVGAPSGSIYHRFNGRPALLADMWLRTEQRFQADFAARLAASPPLEAAISAARHVVCWSRANPLQARVLHAGKRELGYPDWPADRVQATDDADKALSEAVRELVRGLARTHGSQREQVLLAVIDLPYAVVRRHLAAEKRVPPRAEELVARSARAVLTVAASP